MTSITQNMHFRQSLMKYAQGFGVARASRKYNKSKSYIYFWLKRSKLPLGISSRPLGRPQRSNPKVSTVAPRYDGSIESLSCQSRRPHSHPNAHTEAELKLIRDMRRRNPDLGLVELWYRLRLRGYSRCVEPLYRVMHRLGMFPVEKGKKEYVPKPYQQMTHPGERIQIDVKVVPRGYIADPELKLYQYTAIDEFSRYRILGACDEHSTFSSADFLRTIVRKFARLGVQVECVQTDTVSSSPTVSLPPSAIFPRSSKPPPQSWAFATS